MSIMPSLQYVESQDRTVGFEDYGTDEYESKYVLGLDDYFRGNSGRHCVGNIGMAGITPYNFVFHCFTFLFVFRYRGPINEKTTRASWTSGSFLIENGPPVREVLRGFDIPRATLQDRRKDGRQEYADETGITTVQRPNRIYAKKGQNRVGSLTSWEKGKTTTASVVLNVHRSSIWRCLKLYHSNQYFSTLQRSDEATFTTNDTVSSNNRRMWAGLMKTATGSLIVDDNIPEKLMFGNLIRHLKLVHPTILTKYEKETRVLSQTVGHPEGESSTSTSTSITTAMEMIINPSSAEETDTPLPKKTRSEKQSSLIVSPDGNSTFDMFNRVLEVKESLMSVIAINYPENLNINNNDIIIIQGICDVLKLFKDVTEEMSSEKQIEENKIYAEATFLDPRFKRHGFSKDSAFETIKQSIIAQATAIIILEQEKEDSAAEFKKANPKAAAIIEVNKYIEEPLHPRKHDPLNVVPRCFDGIKSLRRGVKEWKTRRGAGDQSRALSTKKSSWQTLFSFLERELRQERAPQEHQRLIINEDTEINVLALVEINPSASIREIARELNIGRENEPTTQTFSEQLSYSYVIYSSAGEQVNLIVDYLRKSTTLGCRETSYTLQNKKMSNRHLHQKQIDHQLYLVTVDKNRNEGKYNHLSPEELSLASQAAHRSSGKRGVALVIKKFLKVLHVHLNALRKQLITANLRWQLNPTQLIVSYGFNSSGNCHNGKVVCYLTAAVRSLLHVPEAPDIVEDKDDYGEKEDPY
ncbi:hypothetical protein NQ317_004751 [Molorchus minor]|uniref:Uncharacterized protein n=1 Tax=Molorchus minor TaxID=1323400 RepID=A0ABQ9JES7_9CUCU|nr:hypothetical protein NQ317_004751 [Molorchus minor]